MPLKANDVNLCRSIRSGAMEGNRSQLLAGYGPSDEQSSVYASLTAIRLDYTEAECRCCHSVKPLVNGYCDVCRSNGANERQCVNPREIEYRSQRGRDNSATSPWKHERSIAKCAWCHTRERRYGKTTCSDRCAELRKASSNRGNQKRRGK